MIALLPSTALTALLLAWCSGSVCLAADAERDTSRAKGVVEGRASVDATVLVDKEFNVAALGEVRARAVARLMTTVRAKDTRSFVKYDAIRQLGEWRVKEAAEMLFQEMDFREIEFDFGKGPFRSYPAAAALAEIGPVAFPRMVQHLARTQSVSDSELKVYAWIVYTWDGRELGLRRLELAAADRRGDAWATRLLAFYRSIDFNQPKDWPKRP